MLKKIIRRAHPSKTLFWFLRGAIVGIIISLIFRINFFSSVCWLILAIIVFSIGIWKPSYLLIAFMFLAGTIAGAYRVGIELIDGQNYEQMIDKEVRIKGAVKGDPDFEDGKKYGNLKMGELRLIGLGSIASSETDIGGLGDNELADDGTTNSETDEIKMRGVIYLYGKLDNKIQRGDVLTISGKMAKGFGAYAGSFCSPKIENIERAEPGSVLISGRNAFANSVKRVLGEGREANLGISYLLGMRNGLDEATTEMLSLVGLTHIVVASGTHLGILVGFFRKYFGKISRFSGMYFSLIFIMLFGQMIGWTASITRAGIVAGLGILGWYAGRKIASWRIILIAMATTLIVNPMFLADLGWQLSFGAFIGIMILGPNLTKFFYGKNKPKIVSEILITTIAATLTCAPILLYNFGSLSLVSVVANIIILPTMPVAMGLVGLSGIVGFLPNTIGFSWIKYTVVKITTVLLRFHLIVMEFFSKQTSFLIQIPKGNLYVFLIYVPIVGLLLFSEVNKNRRRKLRTKMIRENPEEYLRYSLD